MSAYSDWKCGALSDDEYRFCARRDNGDAVNHLEFGEEEPDCTICIHEKYLYTKEDGTKVFECDTHTCEYKEKDECDYQL